MNPVLALSDHDAQLLAISLHGRTARTQRV
jgi:hypothetical protein